MVLPVGLVGLCVCECVSLKTFAFPSQLFLNFEKKNLTTFCVKNGFCKRFCRRKNHFSTEKKNLKQNLLCKPLWTYSRNYDKQLFLPIFLDRNNFLRFFFWSIKTYKIHSATPRKEFNRCFRVFIVLKQYSTKTILSKMWNQIQ